ncbi:MAG: spore coat protein U-like protein [Alcanivorax sp.]|jgi:spore coat protein U-like protein|uniref:Csu type fimbrial protein n=1 Tax=Alcanivorax sp. TaxID=1872427 RepID=UPI0039E5BAFE
MKKLITASAMTAALLGAPLASQAATETGNFDVLLTLTAACTLDSTAPLNFGTQSDADVISATPIDAANTVTVTCSNGADFTIGLSNGGNFGNGPLATERAMKSANSSYVSYQLFQESGRTTPWTDADNVSFSGTGGSQDIDIFGRIPAQTPTIDAADTFDSNGLNLDDNVMVTLTY